MQLLPSHTPVDPTKLGYLGMDIGGSLCKICFFEPANDEQVQAVSTFITTSTEYGTFKI
jgi:hypothetical protein